MTTQDTQDAQDARAAEAPLVVFVCVKNGGKSQIAAGLMRQMASETVRVDSAGTHPGEKLNALAVETLGEVGVDLKGQHPKLLTDELVRAADLVVTLGDEAHVEPVPGTRFETWETDEPSTRGIEGIERMRLVRDDITMRIDDLTHRM